MTIRQWKFRMGKEVHTSYNTTVKKRKLTQQLVDKSKESFLLALELYNKPTIKYRVESFCILFTNAWELLLKAFLFETSKGKKLSIYRPKKPRVKRESISLDECLVKVFTTENDAVKRNIQYISELRNESVHLVLQDFQPYYSRVFQSGVLNYLEKLQEWFYIEPSSYLPPGFLALITKENIPDLEVIKSKYTKEEFNILLGWIQKYDELQMLGDRAAFSIDHVVTITNHPKDPDYVFTTGEGGVAPITIVKNLIDSDKTHPYRRKDVVIKVNTALAGQFAITAYGLEAYLFVMNIKKNNNKYHISRKFGSPQYSELLITELIAAIQKDPRVVENWIQRYKQK